jgi:hypothetical protein
VRAGFFKAVKKHACNSCRAHTGKIKMIESFARMQKNSLGCDYGCVYRQAQFFAV